MRDGDPDRPSRARPVADAPALEPRAEALAKAWLLELVAASPLAAAADLPLDALASEGPPLFAAVARALSADADLDRLAPGGELAPLAARVGALAGARDAAGSLAAVEALRRTVWSAALAEAPRAPAALVADLADRLAAVCATLTAAAFAPAPEAPPPPAAEEEEPPADEPPVQRPIRSFAPRRVDPGEERGHDVERLAELARAAVEENLLRVEDLREREHEGAAPPLVRPPYAGVATEEPGPRVAEGDPRTHLAARAAEFVDEGRPFAVLLVELDGIADLLNADDEAVAAIEAAERALEDLVRPGDAIRRESPGRLWLTLPGAGPAGARALALRAAACVERAAGHRGRPLTASVGVAVCPRDGADAELLAEHAEDTLLAAQAAGSHGAPPPAL